MNQEKEFSCGACGEICEAEEGTLIIENRKAVFNHEASLCPAQDEIEEENIKPIETLQEKLNKASKALEPILWDLLNDIKKEKK